MGQREEAPVSRLLGKKLITTLGSVGRACSRRVAKAKNQVNDLNVSRRMREKRGEGLVKRLGKGKRKGV